jgi:uncharacterized protein (TIGR04141 family)
VADPDDIVDLDGSAVVTMGPVQRPGFAAKAYVPDAVPHPVAWAAFLESGFSGLQVRNATSPSALVIVQAHRTRRGDRREAMFGFAFGVAGRHLIRADAYERGWGLRAALNVPYPRSAAESSRLRAVQSKQRGARVLRSQIQVSHLADFEAFGVNRLRDVLSKASGTPADPATWGGRVGGGDSIDLDVDISFDDLGELCWKLEDAHARDDYRDRFDWIDNIQPVTDPRLVERLEEAVVSLLRSRAVEGLDLAPPEIVDWDRVSSFHYPYDRAQGSARSAVTHPDLRLADYLGVLSRTGRLHDVAVAKLRTSPIQAVDAGGSEQYRWSAWKCLVGEVVLDGEPFILDEGEFFQVRTDYLQQLNDFIARIPSSALALPSWLPTDRTEAHYNERAAACADLLLLDSKTVRITGRTTAIEICDLLSATRQLVHVKRHLGSSDLSHLFAQGLVSAELLQTSSEFRQEAHEKVTAESGGRPGFNFLDTTTFAPTNFEVVYAIIAAWNGRSCCEALPFFSKVNLREVVTDLRSRGFNLGLNQIAA